MNSYRNRFIVVVALTAWMVSAFALQAQTFVIDRCTIDGGGAMRSTDRGFELSGSIGQPDASLPLTGGSFELAGGFWFPHVPGDCNIDGGVNLYDFADFESCVVGPDQELPGPSCACFDRDADSDVDLRDFAEFQIAIQSP